MITFIIIYNPYLIHTLFIYLFIFSDCKNGYPQLQPYIVFKSNMRHLRWKILYTMPSFKQIANNISHEVADLIAFFINMRSSGLRRLRPHHRCSIGPPPVIDGSLSSQISYRLQKFVSSPFELCLVGLYFSSRTSLWTQCRLNLETSNSNNIII